VEALPLSFETVSQEMERRGAGRGSGVPHGYDGLLVRLRGRLLSVQRIGASRVNLELMGKGGVSTVEWSAEGRGGREPVLREGSELEVTGVAEVQYRPRPQLAEPVRMNVLIRDWGDVRVVHAAPWMNAKRAGMLLGGALTVALLGLGWAVLLRRLLGRKTRELADAIRGRKDAAIEFEASLRERARLSANLHDTVLQDVTGLGLQMGSAVSMLSRNAVSEAGEALGVAWRMAQRCQEDLRNAVWALQALPAREGTLVEAVEKLAREYRTLHRLEVVVVAEENLPLLADFVAGNLLLVIREAVHNAMKHAQAREIRIDLGADPGGGGFRVGVSDHGIGMGPEAMQGGTGGHFGLQGMRERVRRLGGTVEIESRPGAGTRIAVRVPLQTFDRELA
jgi:signal transduction histidine kinase